MLGQYLKLRLNFYNKRLSKKIKRIVKLEIIFNKSVENSVESVEKLYYIGESILFSIIWNCTIPGIVLSEFVLSGDPLN